MRQYYQEAAVFSRDARQTYVSFSTAIGIPGGAAFFIDMAVGVIATGWALYTGTSISDALELALVFGGLAALVAFVSGVLYWREFVYGYEKTLLVLSSPGIADEPIRIEHVTNDGRTLRLEKLPGTTAQLYAVSRMAIAGTSLSFRNLKSIYGDQNASTFQAALITKGYAVYRHPDAPRQGIRATEEGIKLFKDTIEQYGKQHSLPPTPRLPGRVEGGYQAYTHTHTHDFEEEDDY